MKDIVKGIWNNWFPNQEISDIAEHRITKCLEPDGLEPHCRYYNPEGIAGPKCDSCGCFLKYKTKSPDSKCPVNKWKI